MTGWLSEEQGHRRDSVKNTYDIQWRFFHNQGHNNLLLNQAVYKCPRSLYNLALLNGQIVLNTPVETEATFCIHLHAGLLPCISSREKKSYL